MTHCLSKLHLTVVSTSSRAASYAFLAKVWGSFLDFRDRPIIKRKSTCFSFRLSPFEYDRTHYYWIIGDYVGTSTLDAQTARKIDEIYTRIRKEREITSEVRKKLLANKCRGSVKCEWAPEKARKMRQKFVGFFGVELNDSGELRETLTGEL